MLIRNLAPDSDTIILGDLETVGGEITIYRDDEGETCVVIVLDDGTEHRMVLGSESETTKL
jgi:hypothetical protein